MVDYIARAGAVAAGLFFMAMVFLPTAPMIRGGVNDFLPMYVSTTLVGGPLLYEPTAYYEFMVDHFGTVHESLVYLRLPFYALLLWPLSLLTYEQAALVWFLYRIAAFAGFIALTARPSAADTMVLSVYSVPLFAALASGQDSIVLLFFVALSVYWVEKGRHFGAGVALSLCSIKPHLLVLLPLLLVLQRRWAVTAGFAAGATGVIVLSTVAAGPQWPLKFLEVITSDRIHAAIANMPNLNGLLFGLPYSPFLLVVASIGVATVCGLALPHVSFRLGMGIVLLGSLLVCYHSFITDCVLLLPLLFEVLSGASRRWLKLLSLAVLAPPLSLVSTADRPYSYIAQITLVVYLCAVVYDSLRSARESRTQGEASRPDPAFQ